MSPDASLSYIPLPEKAAFRPRLVRDVMARDVRLASTTTSVAEAYEMMAEGHFRHLPVVDGRGELAGIVSDRDILQAMPPPSTDPALLAAHGRFASTPLCEIMATSVLTVGESEPLESAADIMLEHRVSALVVQHESGRSGAVVGILTMVDLVSAFRRALALARR